MAKEIRIRIPNLRLKRLWLLTSAILMLLLILMWSGFIPTRSVGMATAISGEEAGQKAIDYINDNFVQTGKATVIGVEEMSGIYKVKTSYQGQEIDVYITKDGKWLFIGSRAIDITATATTTTKPKATCEDITKADKPEMQAFVVSYCPFGLQMQRILVEIIENIPSLAENIKIRYIGSVVNGKVNSMHGETEATENLRQICIREEQSDKYWNYIACFIKERDRVKQCLSEAKVNTTKLDGCMSDNSRGVEYAKEDFDLQIQYGVTGSPTLILNGERVSEFNFGGRTAEAVKTLLCCGFNQQPAACSKKLTTSQAATSFSETYSSGSSGSGSC